MRDFRLFVGHQLHFVVELASEVLQLFDELRCGFARVGEETGGRLVVARQIRDDQRAGHLQL